MKLESMTTDALIVIDPSVARRTWGGIMLASIHVLQPNSGALWKGVTVARVTKTLHSREKIREMTTCARLMT